MINATQLLERFIKHHGGVIPRTGVNWSSTNSDIAFIWVFRFLAVLDLWHATKDSRCIKMMIDAVHWVFTMTDDQIGDQMHEVITDWGPPQQIRRLSLANGRNYARSPRDQVSPGWCRYIAYDRSNKGFRPEILTDGFIGYAIACFINDCRTELTEQTPIQTWLLRLKRIFEYHEPSWRDSYKHSPGMLFNSPHRNLRVAGYWWPAAKDGSIHPTMPGFNQQALLLSMGVLVEKLLRTDIGALDKMQMFCDSTLPRYLQLDSANKRMFHLYDFRQNDNEPSNDTVHAQKANVLFTVATEHGITSRFYQQCIINQVRDICHRGDGRIWVLMHGSDKHSGGYDPDSHASAGMWAECLLWKGGEALLPIAEQTLALEHTDDQGAPKGSHKDYFYRARYLRALEASHAATNAEGRACQTKEQPAAQIPAVRVRLGVKNKKLRGTKDAAKYTSKGSNDDLFHVNGVWRGIRVSTVKAGETVLTWIDTTGTEHKTLVQVENRCP